MEKVDVLINDIKQFEVESTEQYNRDKEIDQTQYFKLVERIDELVVEDFHSSEKFEYFLRYWNQDVRKAGRFVIGKSFRGNSIDQNSFLIISNDFIGVVYRLK